MNQAALIYDKDLTSPLLESYWNILKPYQIDEINSAMNEVCRKNKFWPRPSEVIEKIEGGQIAIESRAEQQWHLVIDAVRKYGLNRPINFDDPITRHILSRGISWGYLCGINQCDEKWEQKRFCNSYQLLADQWQRDPQIEQMPDEVKRLVDGMNEKI